MFDPWKPIETMSHDEIRRYAHELMFALSSAKTAGTDHREVVSVNYIAAVEARMESLGMEPTIRLRRDWI